MSAAGLMFTLGQSATAAAAIGVLMAASQWQITGHAKFLTEDNFERGMLEIDEVTQSSLDPRSRTASVSSTYAPPGTGRRVSSSVGATRKRPRKILAPLSDCRTSSDYVQYTQVIFGENLRDLYSDLQTCAPIDVRDGTV